MWISLEQRGVGLLSEMEGMASQNFEKYFKRSPNLEQIWRRAQSPIFSLKNRQSWQTCGRDEKLIFF